MPRTDAEIDELKSKLSLARKRPVNFGFSGGEKKRNEIFQMAMLEPKLAILDETDSGLDIDALKVVSEGVNKASGVETGVLLVTHCSLFARWSGDHPICSSRARVAHAAAPNKTHDTGRPCASLTKYRSVSPTVLR